MWKIVRGFLGCFPTDIINGRNNLGYHKTIRTNEGHIVEDPNWAKTFCRRFARITLHGIFQLDPNLIILAVLYVAISRTDYRGPIPWSNSGTDLFLDRFIAEMQSQDDSKSVVRIHQKVFSDLVRERKRPTSHFEQLFPTIPPYKHIQRNTTTSSQRSTNSKLCVKHENTVSTKQHVA